MYRSVYELKKEELDELRMHLYFTYEPKDLENIGANTENWNETDWENWRKEDIPDYMVKKSFSHISFVENDFGCNV